MYKVFIGTKNKQLLSYEFLFKSTWAANIYARDAIDLDKRVISSWVVDMNTGEIISEFAK